MCTINISELGHVIAVTIRFDIKTTMDKKQTSSGRSTRGGRAKKTGSTTTKVEQEEVRQVGRATEGLKKPKVKDDMEDVQQICPKKGKGKFILYNKYNVYVL